MGKMKFLVRKASGGDERPFDRAEKETYRHTEILWYVSPSNWEDPEWQKKWREGGTNHRDIEIADPHSYTLHARDVERVCWLVLVNSLEGLGELIDECGDSLVISRDKEVPDMLVMTIYDDYMD